MGNVTGFLVFRQLTENVHTSDADIISSAVAGVALHCLWNLDSVCL